MRLSETEIRIPRAGRDVDLIRHFGHQVGQCVPAGTVPVRFVVTRTTREAHHCEVGVLTGLDGTAIAELGSVFEFRPRAVENSEQFNAVLLVPTGVGAEIGGHAGDAGPVARLLAAACDTLITHPNVVNASDINELPENALYVEGSVICRLLMGTAALRPVRSNRVLLVIDEHAESEISELAINSANAARATLGLDCPGVVKMDPPVRLSARRSSSGSAVGCVEGLERLHRLLLERRGEYDAVALATLIEVPEGIHQEYFSSDGSMVNPWGGVEAMLTHTVSMLFDVPSAHAPMMESTEMLAATFGVVDPRMAAEAVSRCFLHCVLKGLHRAPRLVTDPRHFAQRGVLSAADVSCLVIPDGCVGLPTLAACQLGIPVIAVRENRNLMRNELESLPFAPGKLLVVDNYLEAAGVMSALRAGVAPASIRRPLAGAAVSVSVASSAARGSQHGRAPR